ncbi:MAG: DCC1-like thiol-disulfide oxidoreductase family protein [Bdellovibrionota bacterium]
MKVLFFDGHCSLCNTLVDWVVRRDSKERIRFASLQGQTAKAMLPGNVGKIDFDTVVYSRDGVVYERSTAILKVLGDLGGIWKLAAVFFVIPTSLRNVVYDLVARNRFRFFPRRETCRVPTPEERARLLP